jgi:glyoxylase-like metal-dependent hydrolase (beta-lactamase superfamily II)
MGRGIVDSAPALASVGEENVIIEPLVVGALQTNCYIVGDETSGEGIVIDPGGDAELILEAVRRLKLEIKLVVDTHGHFDHIMANKEVVEGTAAPLAIHPDDAAMLTNPLRSFSFFAGNFHPSPPATVSLTEGSTIEIGSVKLQVLHTPGHSPGSVSLWCAEHKVVFSGDALFNMGIGRTDFPGGSMHILLQSIRDKLFTLPDDTVVYSGHGPQTTIGFERRHNPFLA